MSPQKHSVAWSHFTQVGNLATCNYCAHVITHNPRYGTGNLVRHLKRKHEDISLDISIANINDQEASTEKQEASEQDSTKSSTVQSDFAVLIPIVKLEEEDSEASETEHVEESPASKKTEEETPEPEKPSKCEFCNSSFKTRRQLRIHLRTHTGERPYLCTECGKRYTQLGHLSDHLLVHKGIKTYHCSVLHCSKAFYRKSELERHEKIHTGDKPHKCDICSKSFAQRNNLVMHVKAHKNERPHICKVCQKGFITNSKLNLHAKKHERKLKKALAQVAKAQMHVLGWPKSATVDISSESEDVAEVGKKVRLFED